MSETIEVLVSKLKVNPGDTLVMTTKHDTPNGLELIRKAAGEMGRAMDCKIVVLPASMTLGVGNRSIRSGFDVVVSHDVTLRCGDVCRIKIDEKGLATIEAHGLGVPRAELLSSCGMGPRCEGLSKKYPEDGRLPIYSESPAPRSLTAFVAFGRLATRARTMVQTILSGVLNTPSSRRRCGRSLNRLPWG